MLHGSLLAKLNEIAQHVKGSRQPFGGIQLICTGDFFQLPPVSKRRCVCVCSFTSISVIDDIAHIHPRVGKPTPTSFNNQRARIHTKQREQRAEPPRLLLPAPGVGRALPPGPHLRADAHLPAGGRAGGWVRLHMSGMRQCVCGPNMRYTDPCCLTAIHLPCHQLQTAGGPPQRRALRPPVPHLAAAPQLPQAPRRPAGGDRAHPALRDQREGGKGKGGRRVGALDPFMRSCVGGRAVRSPASRAWTHGNGCVL